QEPSQQRLANRLQPVELRARMGGAGWWQVRVAQLLPRMFQSVTDHFTHAHATGAMDRRSAQKLAQPTGSLMKGGRDPALPVDRQARERIVNADLAENFRLHQQSGGMHNHRVE